MDADRPGDRSLRQGRTRFQIELPPYTQDLADAGKLTSFGYGFINSYNTEMAGRDLAKGGQPIEAGASANDYDFLHIINWQKAEEVFKAGEHGRESTG